MALLYKPLPATEELWELFEYKPLTGELVRRVRAGRVLAGTPFGAIAANGYRSGCVRNSRYYAHRLVYAWVTGTDPGDLDIDHRDSNRDNNCFWNLRVCTRTQNNFNRQSQGFVRQGNRYYAQICVGDRNVLALGGYASEAEAYEAYKKAALELHGEFAKV
jgi:hypothetical protein